MIATMTIEELIEVLRSCADDAGEDAEVRLAIRADRASEPFRHDIDGVVAVNGVVWIGVTDRLGPLPHAVGVALEWEPRT